MTRKEIVKEILLGAGILGAGLMLIALLMNSCGLGPERNIRVEVEQPPPQDPVKVIVKPEQKFCEGGEPVSTVRELECPDKLEGSIKEVCKQDGSWGEISRDCKLSCEEDAVSWDGYVKNVMVENCAGCHGAYRDYEPVRNLARQGLGGAGGISKLIYYITLPESNDDSMPKDKPNLPADVIQKLKEWVDQGAIEKSSCEEYADVVDQFYIDSHINIFGSQIPQKSERQNFRFMVMAHKFNQGFSLEPSYKAINRALNSISFQQDIQLCQPIDQKGVICAIDIRSIGRTRDDFRAIQYGDDFKYISNTTLGLINQELFNTDQPFFHYDVFIDAVFDNTNIYNHIMRFINKDQFFSIFGIDFQDALIANEYKLMGTNQSQISAAEGGNTRLNAVFEGDLGLGIDTQIHISFDNEASDDPLTDLFQNPFLSNSNKIFSFIASEAIAGLPNGLHAYILANNVGVLQDFAPTTIVICNRFENTGGESDHPRVQGCRESQVDAPIDCLLCHGHVGYIPFKDVIGDHIRNSRQFNAADVLLSRQLYLDDNQNFATFTKHNERYLAALNKMGIQVGERNNLIEDYVILSKPKDLKQIAAFFFVAEQYLRNCINASQKLSELAGGLLTGAKLTRESLIGAFPVFLEECEINIDPTIPVGG